MPLTANGVIKTYGAQEVLSGVDLGLNPGDRISLIGANGVGKSTLLRILAGLESSDEGTVAHSARDEVGYLAQTVPIVAGETIQDAIASSVAGLQALERRMRELETLIAGSVDAVVLDEYGEISHHFELRGGYELDANIDRVLAGLGVGYLTRDRKVAELSGGEKARVALAAMLLSAPDVLLLDEPTNDLDDRALGWLEEYLVHYGGGILFVSHDRDFIDRIATSIVELDEHSRTLIRYEGNYARYLQVKRAARLRRQQEYDAQQDEIAQLKEKLRTTARSVGHGRAAPDNDKHAYNFRGKDVERAVSRNVRATQERLARIAANLLRPAPEPLRFTASFGEVNLLKNAIVVDARDLDLRYGERVVLDHVSCILDASSRVCLVGPNGVGKSSLLKVLVGAEQPAAGAVAWRKNIRIGYLRQDPQLPAPRETVAANLTLGLRQAGLAVPDQAPGWLVRWGLLERDDLRKRAGELSTGQQRKVELGILIAAHPDVLLLDEPTNHLSFDVIESLQEALATFSGPVLMVTHDRRLIRQFPTTVWSLDQGKLLVSDHTPGGET